MTGRHWEILKQMMVCDKYLNGRVSGIEIFQQAEVLSIDHALLLSDGILVLNPLVYSDRFRTGHSLF